jgi:pSer/pThr/pTyr-binding forkhead associated (FHA) protein
VNQVIPQGAEEDGEMMTNVRKRVVELYKLEIWMNNVRQNVVPIFNKEIVIGRGSRSKPVDIALSGDPEISRRHVTIGTDGNGTFWVINEGRNPAMINNTELSSGQRVQFRPGVGLNVGSYLLRIQPK